MSIVNKYLTIEEMAKEVAKEAMENIEINGMTFDKFIEKLNNAVNENCCHFTTCRYNHDGTCKNDECRKECVEVSKLVLCLEGKENDT